MPDPDDRQKRRALIDDPVLGWIVALVILVLFFGVAYFMKP
jgi:hypothetical protein